MSTITSSIIGLIAASDSLSPDIFLLYSATTLPHSPCSMKSCNFSSGVEHEHKKQVTTPKIKIIVKRLKTIIIHLPTGQHSRFLSRILFSMGKIISAIFSPLFPSPNSFSSYLTVCFASGFLSISSLSGLAY